MFIGIIDTLSIPFPERNIPDPLSFVSSQSRPEGGQKWEPIAPPFYTPPALAVEGPGSQPKTLEKRGKKKT